MLLEPIGDFNNLSEQLRKELTEKVKSFGKRVRYKFNISNPNPDPSKYNGDVIWPNVYSLDPTVFTIKDYDGKVKKVALVEQEIQNDRGGKEYRFRKVKVKAGARGILELNLEDNQDDVYTSMLLELHPKLTGGKFLDKQKQQVFSRVDEKAAATEQRSQRSIRKLAMDTAEKMSDEEVVEFADGMTWDSTEELSVLRNKIEDLAEHSPELFNDKVNDKKIKYQAAIKRALDRKIWQYDPIGGKLTWESTGQVIIVIPSNDGIPYDGLATWFMTAGGNADKAYNKLISLEKKETVTT